MYSTTKTVLASIAALIAVVSIGLAIWGLTVAFSPVAGKAAVYQDQNSSQNREYWSAKYNGDYAQLQADQANIQTLKGSIQTQQDRINLQGAQLNCRTDVATYNTDTQNVLGFKFLPQGLPSTIIAAQYCG